MGKSSAWEHFTRDTLGSSSKCNYCGLVIRNRNTTTGLWYHLRARHVGVIASTSTQQSLEDVIDIEEDPEIVQQKKKQR